MRWNNEETDFLRGNYPNFTTNAMALKLNRDCGSVENKIFKLKLRKRYKLCKRNMKLTENLGYILGVLEGDGTICFSKGTAVARLEVADEDFANNFYNCLKEQFGIEPHKYHQKSCWNYKGMKHSKYYWIITVYKKPICKFLKEFDIQNILKAEKHIKSAFLKGLYDSEGSVELSKSNSVGIISFSNKDSKIIRIVSSLLSEFGINHHISEKREISLILITNRDNFLKFKKYIGFSIGRKMARLNNNMPLEHNFYIENSLRNELGQFTGELR